MPFFPYILGHAETSKVNVFGNIILGSHFFHLNSTPNGLYQMLFDKNFNSFAINHVHSFFGVCVLKIVAASFE